MKSVDWEGVYDMYYGFRDPETGDIVKSETFGTGPKARVKAKAFSDKIKLENYSKNMKRVHVIQKRLY